MDALPNPNSKYFLKELCSKLLKSMSNNAPFDENIFTWILYCLAVGDKHLVLVIQKLPFFTYWKPGLTYGA